MARPHIEFVQAQALDWGRGLPSGSARPDVGCKTLSLDDETGAATCVVRYPAGWSDPNVGHLTTDEEFYVLEGSLTINGIDYEHDSYAHLPAGHLRNSAISKSGAVLLTFFAGPVNAELSMPPGVRSAPTAWSKRFRPVQVIGATQTLTLWACAIFPQAHACCLCLTIPIPERLLTSQALLRINRNLPPNAILSGKSSTFSAAR